MKRIILLFSLLFLSCKSDCSKEEKMQSNYQNDTALFKLPVQAIDTVDLIINGTILSSPGTTGARLQMFYVLVDSVLYARDSISVDTILVGAPDIGKPVTSCFERICTLFIYKNSRDIRNSLYLFKMNRDQDSIVELFVN